MITVKAGENIMDIVPAAEVFYYPQFTEGQVFLKDGTKSTARLNYNRLVDEVHFINARGDTLALADEKNIAFIRVATDSFYYNEGYLRLLASGGGIKLALKEVWIVAETKQLGAFNTTNPSVSVLSFKTMNESGRLYDLTVNADVVLKKTEQFYLGDRFNRFVPATKKSLLELFSKNRDQLEQYLKENKTNFNNREDLESLVQFLSHL